jgi:carboxypeptidase PM20D1
MKKLLAALGALLVVLAAVTLVRATQFAPRRVPVPSAVTVEPLPGAVDRLVAAIRIPSVSPADSARRDSAAFHAMHAHLARSFPRVHAAMGHEVVGKDALLYTWVGTDSALPPIVLMGHFDVVPVEPGTEERWTHPPFSGALADGHVWGRGALDDKSTVLGVLEASEALLAQGFAPRSTVYLAFGADEEVGGERGAAVIAAMLRSRGVRPHFVLDEGGAVVAGVAPGVRAAVALVGIAEKGFASLELVVRAEGGHSSMPPRHTAAGVLARAITKVEGHPFPASIRGAASKQLDALGREMSFGRRVIFANRWLFDPAIERQLAASPQTDAMLRTTTAVTMLEGSPKDNVLPSQARAVVNFRILPGDSIAGVVDHVRRVIDDLRVDVGVVGIATEPSQVSPTNTDAWALLERSIRQVYSDAVVVPYLVLGGTDSRYFRDLTPNVYRFAGIRLDAEDLSRFHGTNERIAVASYLEGIRFLAQLLRNAAG